MIMFLVLMMNTLSLQMQLFFIINNDNVFGIDDEYTSNQTKTVNVLCCEPFTFIFYKNSCFNMDEEGLVVELGPVCDLSG